jgi:hypothetical protein
MQPDQTTTPKPGELRWQAYEFIYHPKNFLWLFTGTILSLVVAGLSYAISRFTDIIPAISIFAAGIIFMAYANKKPRKLNYKIDVRNLTIQDKIYPLAGFSGYYIDKFSSAKVQITLIGSARFSVPISLNFNSLKLASRVLEVLAKKVPETAYTDRLADKFAHKVRF